MSVGTWSTYVEANTGFISEDNADTHTSRAHNKGFHRCRQLLDVNVALLQKVACAEGGRYTDQEALARCLDGMAVLPDILEN